MPARDLITVSANWRTSHARESQYCTQIVKCHARSRCREPRSSLFNILQSRFLPPPIPLIQTSEGLKAPDHGSESEINFTTAFITVTECSTFAALITDQLQVSAIRFILPVSSSAGCVRRGLYHASMTSLKSHTRACGTQQVVPRVCPVPVAARRQREREYGYHRL